MLYEDKLLTQKQAAEMLGTTERSLGAMRNSGKINIPVIKWGVRGIRFSEKDILKYIEENRK